MAPTPELPYETVDVVPLDAAKAITWSAHKEGIYEGAAAALKQWPGRIPQRLVTWLEALEQWKDGPSKGEPPEPESARMVRTQPLREKGVLLLVWKQTGDRIVLQGLPDGLSAVIYDPGVRDPGLSLAEALLVPRWRWCLAGDDARVIASDKWPGAGTRVEAEQQLLDALGAMDAYQGGEGRLDAGD